MDRNRTIGWGDHASIRRLGDVERESAFGNGFASCHCIRLLYLCPVTPHKEATALCLQLKEIQISRGTAKLNWPLIRNVRGSQLMDALIELPDKELFLVQKPTDSVTIKPDGASAIHIYSTVISRNIELFDDSILVLRSE